MGRERSRVRICGFRGLLSGNMDDCTLRSLLSPGLFAPDSLHPACFSVLGSAVMTVRSGGGGRVPEISGAAALDFSHVTRIINDHRSPNNPPVHANVSKEQLRGSIGGVVVGGAAYIRNAGSKVHETRTARQSAPTPSPAKMSSEAILLRGHSSDVVRQP